MDEADTTTSTELSGTPGSPCSILKATLTDIALRLGACDLIDHEDPFRMGRAKRGIPDDSTDEGAGTF